MIIPTHVGIIMDGNGRWAKKRFLAKSAGHKMGADNLKKLSNYVESLGIKYLTVYAFSTENWSRSDEEVNYLLNLLREYIKKYIEDSEKNNMKINIIGDITRFDSDLINSILYLEKITKNKQGLNVIIAINYGGRDEIVRATKKMLKDILKTNLDVNSISEINFKKYLDTANYPDPDLIIRTSGEYRLSNFLTFQSAYSELYFSEVLWPDFNEKEFLKAIEEYSKRERRFGSRL